MQRRTDDEMMPPPPSRAPATNGLSNGTGSRAGMPAPQPFGGGSPQAANASGYNTGPIARDVMSLAEDEGVKTTNEDAAISKLSSANMSYFYDPWLKNLLTNPHQARRSPLMNRGYYARVSAVRMAMSRFLNAFPTTPVQIVNLGAGLDSSFWWLQQQRDNNLTYFEIDFDDVINTKMAKVSRKRELWSVFDTPDKKIESSRDLPFKLNQWGVREIHSEKGNFLAADLRQPRDAEASLLGAGFKKDVPTLFLSECVLVYMTPDESDAIIKWVAQDLMAPGTFAAMCAYEQTMLNSFDSSPEAQETHGNDPFGRMMIKNLRDRGCPLLSFDRHPTPNSQMTRFAGFGWEKTICTDMLTVYDEYIDENDRQRVQTIEMFDELEEWRLINQHYFCLVAVQGGTDNAKNMMQTWWHQPEAIIRQGGVQQTPLTRFPL